MPKSKQSTKKTKARPQQDEDRKPIDDPRYRAEMRRLDTIYHQLFNMLPKPVDVRIVDMGEVKPGSWLRMEIEQYCPTCIVRITFKVNGIFKATARFKVNEQGMWQAVSDVSWWCNHPIFQDEHQIGTQYLSFLKTNRKQKGIRGAQTVPMFAEMAVAS